MSNPPGDPPGLSLPIDTEEESITLQEDDLEPLIGDDEPKEEKPQIRTFEKTGFAGSGVGVKLNRPLQTGEGSGGAAATRCRIFHAKLNDGALQFMEDQINEWADGNPDITIKQSSSQVGVVEGKHPEPHLVITIFY